MVYAMRLAAVALAISPGHAGQMVQIRRFTSKLHPHKSYGSSEEFWRDHVDPVGERLNRTFRNQHLIVKKISYLENNGKTLVQEQYFRSRADFQLMEELKLKFPTRECLNVVSHSEYIV